jgi:hypothetical protein
MDSDCDDAAALAMLHARADRGEVTILATSVSTLHAWSVPCTDALNTLLRTPGCLSGQFKMDSESTVRTIAALADATGVRIVFRERGQGPHSADLIAVHVAARGTGRPWKLVRGGHNFIFPDGRHAWRESPNNPRHQLISALAAGVVAAELDMLIRHEPKRPGR